MRHSKLDEFLKQKRISFQQMHLEFSSPWRKQMKHNWSLSSIPFFRLTEISNSMFRKTFVNIRDFRPQSILLVKTSLFIGKWAIFNTQNASFCHVEREMGTLRNQESCKLDFYRKNLKTEKWKTSLEKDKIQTWIKSIFVHLIHKKLRFTEK